MVSGMALQYSLRRRTLPVLDPETIAEVLPQLAEYASCDSGQWDVPERALLWAQLHHILLSVLNTTNSRQLGEDSWWVFWDPEQDRPHSFTYVCDYLHIDPDRVRHALKGKLVALGRWLPQSVCQAVAVYERMRRVGPKCAGKIERPAVFTLRPGDTTLRLRHRGHVPRPRPKRERQRA